MNVQIPLSPPRYEQGLFMAVWVLLIVAVIGVMAWSLSAELSDAISWPQLMLYGVLLVVMGAMMYWQYQQMSHLYRHVNELGYIEQQWYLVVDGEKHIIELVGEQTLWPWLIRLSFRNETTGKTESLMLFPSATGDEKFRALSRILHFS